MGGSKEAGGCDKEEAEGESRYIEGLYDLARSAAVDQRLKWTAWAVGCIVRSIYLGFVASDPAFLSSLDLGRCYIYTYTISDIDESIYPNKKVVQISHPVSQISLYIILWSD